MIPPYSCGIISPLIINEQSMNQRWVFISGLLALGIIIGIAITNVGEGYRPSDVTDTTDVSDIDASSLQQPSDALSSWVVSNEVDAEPAQALLDKVFELEARVLELEQKLDSQSEAGTNAQANARVSAASYRSSQQDRMLTIQSLVKAGIDKETAADIVRRRSEIELKKLTLHDRATREGYIGTTRYADELSDLLAEVTTLREDLGDDAYDHYLYANKRPNRVKAASVIPGSAAEQAGMKDGDIILTYGELRIFEWDELKRNTSKGKLDEYVSIDILRDGQLMNFWMPRGPLGVRLGVARMEPGT